MLERLERYRLEIASRAHKCENVGSRECLDDTDDLSDSPFNQRADQVNHNLDDAIEGVEKQLMKIRDNTIQWEAVDKLKDDLEAWLTSKAAEVNQLEDRPAKLHDEAAQLEISHLEVGKIDISKTKWPLEKAFKKATSVLVSVKFVHYYQKLKHSRQSTAWN